MTEDRRPGNGPKTEEPTDDRGWKTVVRPRSSVAVGHPSSVVGPPQTYKFEKLEVYQVALDYLDVIYGIAERLPRNEEYNLRSQVVRAATSIVLNIAEGSTSQSDAEQSRFLGMALRSLVETVACLHIMERRHYLDSAELNEAYMSGQKLFAKMQAMRRALGTEDRGPKTEGRPMTADRRPRADR